MNKMNKADKKIGQEKEIEADRRAKDETENQDLNGIIGKEAAVFMWVSDEVRFIFDESSELRVSNLNSFWRWLEDGKIVFTSNDFYLRSRDPLDFYCSAVDEEMLDNMRFDADSEEELFSKACEKLEEAAEGIVDRISGSLESSVLEKVQTNDIGDLRLFFSNGSVFEIFPARSPDSNNKIPYEIIVR